MNTKLQNWNFGNSQTRFINWLHFKLKNIHKYTSRAIERLCYETRFFWIGANFEINFPALLRKSEIEKNKNARKIQTMLVDINRVRSFVELAVFSSVFYGDCSHFIIRTQMWIYGKPVILLPTLHNLNSKYIWKK